ncbi:hypothetical protein CEXT_457271 [Caerostris extrusa]|uniref:Uncharacterized protein n=1 Tax=Caerostris extrusa TaxID=172846 RepID=A0AAV4PX58_CAEEX|nr:hypothetical protein CEXT_457271 [Caerostris extrusa]
MHDYVWRSITSLAVGKNCLSLNRGSTVSGDISPTGTLVAPRLWCSSARGLAVPAVDRLPCCQLAMRLCHRHHIPGNNLGPSAQCSSHSQKMRHLCAVAIVSVVNISNNDYLF